MDMVVELGRFFTSGLGVCLTAAGTFATGYVTHLLSVRKQHAEFLDWSKRRSETKANMDEELERMKKSLGLLLELQKNDLTPEALLDWHGKVSAMNNSPMPPREGNAPILSLSEDEVTTLWTRWGLSLCYATWKNDEPKNPFVLAFERRYGDDLETDDEVRLALTGGFILLCRLLGQRPVAQVQQIAMAFMKADIELGMVVRKDKPGGVN